MPILLNSLLLQYFGTDLKQVNQEERKLS